MTLFDFDLPISPNVTAPAEAVPRLSRQCEMILARLRHGRASNRTLAAIALKYTSRCSDLRAAGYDVRCVSHDKVSGLAVYALFQDGIEVAA